MRWYCVLIKGETVNSLNPDQLYEYRTTRDYDQMFTVFNGKIWVECDPNKFNMYYLIKQYENTPNNPTSYHSD